MWVLEIMMVLTLFFFFSPHQLMPVPQTFFIQQPGLPFGQVGVPVGSNMGLQQGANTQLFALVPVNSAVGQQIPGLPFPGLQVFNPAQQIPGAQAFNPALQIPGPQVFNPAQQFQVPASLPCLRM